MSPSVYEKLHTLELKSLLVLDILLETRNLSEVGRQLSMRQGNVSYHLAKLRTALDDQLLVKSGKGYTLTSRAANIKKSLHQSLANLQDSLFDEPFNPKTATITFRIMADPIGAGLLIPRLLSRLKTEAPSITIEHIPAQKKITEVMASGMADVVLYNLPEQVPELNSHLIATMSIYLVTDKKHPIRKTDYSFEKIFSYPTIQRYPYGYIEHELSQITQSRNLTRSVSFIAPSFELLRDIIPGSENVAFCFEADKYALSNNPDLHFHKLEQMAPSPTYAMWHPRCDNDPVHQFMRKIIIEECLQLATIFSLSGS
ncbi:LysR family transcriptional regulator [Endozoicomonas lisbonensis]|uniref:DNA-binding transcriptional LysR family regulator n=1 Tax=Endozoicomonas lisbonensis TaxID=3120522 RepID=A0ABV2SLI6_9GAMM